MINGIQLKVCGITRPEDARAAAAIGADYLGFILYPGSPRYLVPDVYQAFSQDLPDLPRVAVMVKPSCDELIAAREQGFDFFQLHFDPENDRPLVESWVDVVDRECLWLAPRLPPETPFPDWLLPLADTFLVDTFHKDSFGGTGVTGDWGRFREHLASHPDKRWVLAGGLNPDNIAEAVNQTGAAFIDLSSGIEESPGLKDPEKLKALRAALD